MMRTPSSLRRWLCISISAMPDVAPKLPSIWNGGCASNRFGYNPPPRVATPVTPTGVNKDNPCLAVTLNRAWQVWLDSGLPYVVKDAAKPEASERYTDLKQGGIAPGTAIIMTEETDKDGKNKRDPICLNGVEAKKCPNIGSVTRTFWERQ